jgi:hypothetical protein
VAIDTTPDVPRLDIIPPPVTQVFIDRQSSFTQGLQQTDARVVTTELTATSERYLELEVVAPDGTVISRHRIRDEALYDLRAFFATLPDNHYRIYLVRTENNSRRLIMDVYVRRGRVIDPSDDSEGTRDRPPTSEEAVQVDTPPLEENRLLEPVPNEPPGSPAVPTEEPAADLQGSVDDPTAADDGIANGKVGSSETTETDESEIPNVPALVPLRGSLRWVVPLAGVGLAIGRRGWSQQVAAALEQASEVNWQRLRRAGRMARRSNQP